MSKDTGYRWDVNNLGVVFEVDRLRRERHELIGELGVKCALPGARTVNGYLLIGDLNFSSVRARSDRAKMLGERARSNGQIDWIALLEEFTQRVATAEREGDPACNLWDIPRSPQVEDFSVLGIHLPRRHPAILFGDGGSAKSYVALYIAGCLAAQGQRVALFDWELSGEEHRERCERLFDRERPEITYCRCERPLTGEADRLSRVVRDRKIVYAIFDSISFAVDGRPEDAEIAGRYFQALRRMDIGSLHIAHVNKSEDHERKPFGSSFWHNGARSTWYVQAEDSGGGVLDLGFYHRKSNLGALRQPLALRMSFTNSRTYLDKADIADSPELSEKLTVRQRMAELLNHGAKTVQEIADELGEKPDTVRKVIRRGTQFIVIQGAGSELDRVGLKAKHA